MSAYTQKNSRTTLNINFEIHAARISRPSVIKRADYFSYLTVKQVCIIHSLSSAIEP